MKGAKGKAILFIIVMLGFIALSYFGIPAFSSFRYGVQDEPTALLGSKVLDISQKEPKKPKVLHLETPEPFKAIYMSQCVAGTPSFRDQLVDLINDTELNSVIIDIKDYSGKIAFPTDNPVLRDSVSDECGARDMKSFIERLHGDGIYVVGRITVFQDPYYTGKNPQFAVKKASDGTVWKDYKGLSFIDVSARDYWDYVVELSKEAYGIGFDEVNLDYIRFPSDGNMKDIAYPYSGVTPKADALEAFFSHLYGELDDTELVLSADLFGYTTTNADDLGIGQIIERALPYFDYVMPMVYPSHYNPGFIGIENPAAHPYEVVKYSMEKGVERAKKMQLAKSSPRADSGQATSTSPETEALRELANKGHASVSPSQLRPWLQDFDLGAKYTPEMVTTQMKATYDAGLTSWALWDAGNTYTRSALQPE